MGNSLQDQLLKAGIGNKKQAVKARKAKNNKQKLKAAGVEVVDEVERLAKISNEEKVERDRELNRQKQELATEKAIAAQIRQLVELNRESERGDIEFRFTDDTSIKTLMLQEGQRKALVAGKLAIVRDSNMDGETYDIVPRAVAEKIAERNNALLVLCNDRSEGEEDTIDDDYADFKVPDDMMW